MWIARRKLSFAVRALLLFTLLAAPNLNSQIASAQRVPTRARNSPLTPSAAAAPPGPASPEVLNHLGIQRPQASDLTALSQQIASRVRTHGLPAAVHGQQQPTVGGLTENLLSGNTQSASILTTLNSAGGSNFRDVMLMADADGREDLVADHAAKVDDLTTANLPSGWMLTRAATSEHTIANGYTETVYYYGDSVGNVYVAVDNPPSSVLTYTVLNLPTVLNAFGSLDSDHQIVVTGLAVNPVADLTSFPNVNGGFIKFAGQIGEILYVAFWDTNGGMRSYSNGQIIQSGVLAFPIADMVSPAASPPGVQSVANFPVTVGGAFGVAFSTFANVAGVAVDDDGSIYYQQVDLANFTGANIVKISSYDKPGPGASRTALWPPAVS